MKRFTIMFVFAIVAAACGGADKRAVEPEAGGGMAEHAKLTPELQAFHDLLSPRWHAPVGDARMADTCGVVADFETTGAAIAAAPAAEGADPAAWTESGAALVAAVVGLKTACGGADVAAFDAAFGVLHEAFHHSMKLVLGEHEHDPGKHEAGMHEAGGGPGDQH